MKVRSYGVVDQTCADDEIARCVEEIAVRGFTILPDVFSTEELTLWRQKIDSVYAMQEAEFGHSSLESIQDLDVCRAPLLRDFDFVEMARHPRVLAVVRHFLGDWFILNLQNAIINRPKGRHHQTAWHRDFPYQNFVISRPLGINAIFVIDEFSAATGGTQVLPFSHKIEALPSDSYIQKNHVIACATAGSVIVFDVMLFHQAGINSSAVVRRGVNHLYTIPIMKQQYDFPRALEKNAAITPDLARLLGFTSQVPIDDAAWRKARAIKISQGR